MELVDCATARFGATTAPITDATRTPPRTTAAKPSPRTNWTTSFMRYAPLFILAAAPPAVSMNTQALAQRRALYRLLEHLQTHFPFQLRLSPQKVAVRQRFQEVAR